MKTDTETLIKTMRILAQDIDSEDGVANSAIGEAADRLEELQLELTETIKELNHWQCEVTKERIKTEKAYKLRKDAEIQRDSLRDTMALDILELTMQRDEARAEVERLKDHVPDVRKMVRPEPSRLEIAAMLCAACWADHKSMPMKPEAALKIADALIAAAKEGAK